MDETTSAEYECKTCGRCFDCLQRCLRHELLQHFDLKKISHKTKRTKKWKTDINCKREEETLEQRVKIHEALEKCPTGVELQKLFEFYYVPQEKANQYAAAAVYSLLEDLQSLGNIEVHPFGSVKNGLMMDDSDIDLFVWSGDHSKMDKNQIYTRIEKLLRRGLHFDDVTSVRRARVPIIKCRHIATGFKVDINCTCKSSVENTKFVRQLLLADSRVNSLICFLKIWAKQLHLIGHGNGRMTSYSFIMLILFYLQQPHNGRRPLVPSVQEMQTNESPKYIHGINYAFNIHKHAKSLPIDLTTYTLIKGFFDFYNNFDFGSRVISPFLGTSVPLQSLSSKEYSPYNEFLSQLSELAKADKAESLKTPMIVQDPFQLQYNIAKVVTDSHCVYFRSCLAKAFKISTEMSSFSIGKFYETLLFDVVSDGEMQENTNQIDNESTQSLAVAFTINTDSQSASSIALPSPAASVASTTASASSSLPTTAKNGLVYTLNIEASSEELKFLMGRELNSKENENDSTSIYRHWSRHYLEFIYDILKNIFCLRVKIVSSERGSPNVKSVIESSLKLLRKKLKVEWFLEGDINVWSGRQYRSNNSQNFFKYQRALTKALMFERSRMESFNSHFSAFFTVKTSKDFHSLHFSLYPQKEDATDDFLENSKYHDFFSNFKSLLDAADSETKFHATLND